MSIVFYPEKGIITYGSELAAVKAGLDFEAPAEIPLVKPDPHGKFDVTKFIPLSRLGYRDYSMVDKTFTLARPDD